MTAQLVPIVASMRSLKNGALHCVSQLKMIRKFTKLTAYAEVCSYRRFMGGRLPISESFVSSSTKTFMVVIRATNSIEFYSSSSSTYFSKSEFKFEFSNLIFTSSSSRSTKISFFEFKLSSGR